MDRPPCRRHPRRVWEQDRPHRCGTSRRGRRDAPRLRFPAARALAEHDLRALRTFKVSTTAFSTLNQRGDRRRRTRSAGSRRHPQRGARQAILCQPVRGPVFWRSRSIVMPDLRLLTVDNSAESRAIWVFIIPKPPWAAEQSLYFERGHADMIRRAEGHVVAIRLRDSCSNIHARSRWSRSTSHRKTLSHPTSASRERSVGVSRTSVVSAFICSVTGQMRFRELTIVAGCIDHIEDATRVDIRGTGDRPIP